MEQTHVYPHAGLRPQAVNLHILTRCSDGGFTPRQIVEKALENRLDLISITDHDTVEAYRYLSKSQIPLRLLPGLEFSSTWDGNDIHVLGFGIDIHNQQLLEILHWMSEGRKTRAQKMLAKLKALDIKVPFELVLSFAGEKKLIVRPHIAQALLSLGYVKSRQEAFEKYIGNDKPAYVPKPILPTPEVIDYIHAATGVAVLAHPGKLKQFNYLQDFVKAGLDGLEVWHPDHADWQIMELTNLAERFGLLKTGGSDFHGEQDIHNYFGAVPVSDEILKDVDKIWNNYLCHNN